MIQQMLAIWSLVHSFAFSKSSLNIWKFTVNVLLKPGLENFEHYFASMSNECNCGIVWTSRKKSVQTLVPRIWLFKIPHIRRSMQYLSFYDWLVYFTCIMPLIFIHVVTYRRISFLVSLNNIPLYIYIYIYISHFYPFICPWRFKLVPYFSYYE